MPENGRPWSMVTDELLRRCEAVAADDVSGATDLTLKVCDILSEAVARGRLESVIHRLRTAKPMMASILNAVQLATSPGEPDHVRHLLHEFRDTLRLATKRAAGSVSDWLLSHCDSPYRVVTISASAVVESTLRDLGSRGLVSSIVVGESRPRNEGTRMAERLAPGFPDLQVTHDAALPGLVDRDAVVLIGADAVLPDRVINKVGSLPLCLSAHRWSRPAVVVTTSHKVLSREARDFYRLPPPVPGPGRFIDVLFEEVPRDLLSAVVTEGGPL